MNPRRKALWLGVALGAAAALIAVLSLVQGAGKLVILAVLLAAPVVIIVISARMRQRTG